MKHFQIALDGPSGAGKSTMARHVAEALGIAYLDTGAMYRAVALKGLRGGVELGEGEAMAKMLESTSLDIVYRDGNQRVLLDGEDVSEAIRSNEVSMGASRASAHPVVRRRMVAIQQEIARRNSVIMDGRDIGTHVLPEADIKIFLTATAEDRAMRRFQEQQEKGLQDRTYESLLEEIKTRDHDDSTREHSPLKQAEDAIVLDTTGFSLEEGIAAIMAAVKTRMV